jgi:two-component system, response regulator
MSVLTRILLIEDTQSEWRLALSNLTETGLMPHTTVVKDQGEALDFLHARGPFRRRPSGLPAVVVLGPSITWSAGLSLLKNVRNDLTLRRLPVVIIAAEPDAQMVQTAYEHGANSLVRRHDDVKVHAEQCATLALFWGWANEPPPGCLPQPKAQRRLQ